MTLDEIKDAVAKELKYKSFALFESQCQPGEVGTMVNEVCKRHAFEVAKEKDEEDIFVSCESPNDVYAAFTDKNRAEWDATESGVKLCSIKLHRGQLKK